MIALAENTYGKSSVRVMKVQRDGPLHTVKEWKVEVLLSGDFETCFTLGDNSEILPTDTMKNTVYSRARESTAECMEDFARELAEFFLARNPQVERVTIGIASTASHRFATYRAFVNAADTALYEAKDAGRNRILCYPVAARAHSPRMATQPGH